MVQADMKKLLVIAGPTAVGKSAMAVEAAKALGGEIISADSMQLYRGLDIGTAKITEPEKQGIIHHMIDIINPQDAFSAADFRVMADKIISDISARGKIPIICGGTGLYLNALLYEYDFAAEDRENTSKLREELIASNNDTLYERLKSIDSAAAAEIHPNNKKRVARALEIALSGKKKSETAKHGKSAPRYNHSLIVLHAERDLLYRRINERVDKMMRDGLSGEVDVLYKSGIDGRYQSMQAIGYKQILEMFNGKYTPSEATDKIKQFTRNYAKRQITWLKKMRDAVWLNIDNNDRQSIVKKVLNAYENN